MSYSLPFPFFSVNILHLLLISFHIFVGIMKQLSPSLSLLLVFCFADLSLYSNLHIQVIIPQNVLARAAPVHDLSSVVTRQLAESIVAVHDRPLQDLCISQQEAGFCRKEKQMRGGEHRSLKQTSDYWGHILRGPEPVSQPLVFLSVKVGKVELCNLVKLE